MNINIPKGSWKKRSKDWIWYAAAFAILGPFILIIVFDPDWLMRLIGVAYFSLGFPAILFWYAFGPKKNLGSEGRTIWPKYILNRFGDSVYTGTRILLAILAGISFYFLTLPLAVDLITVAQGKAPLNGSGTVTDVEGSSINSFIFQNINFNGDNSIDGRFHTWYFLLGSIKYGNTYEFIYLPNTRVILDAKQK